MIKQKLVMLFLISFSLVSLSGLVFVPKSYAATLSPRSSACGVVRVILHDKASPTLTCVAAASTNAAVHPLISDSCSGGAPRASDYLLLYYNGPVGAAGPVLCVYGGGVLNLNQTIAGVAWNDKASAWWTGCQNAWFYTNINQGGNWAFAPGSADGLSSPSGVFPYDSEAIYGSEFGSGTVGNDQLSSVWMPDVTGIFTC